MNKIAGLSTPHLAPSSSMETNTRASVGPVPFEEDTPFLSPSTTLQEDLVSTLPSVRNLRCYQGTWLLEQYVTAAIALQRRFHPRHDDVIVASFPKSGTTWVNALTFATMARAAYPPAAADHPLLRLNPHQCLPFLEGLFGGGTEAKLEALPSPRLMNTHMPLQMLPRASACKVVYVCREPKDMVVSLWHYIKRAVPELTFHDSFEYVCSGMVYYGPIWDHILGYWRASVATPHSVLFLQYEQLLRDPADNVRKLARFLGQPFSAPEEEADIVGDIVRLCSFGHLQSLEPNRTGSIGPIPREALFRKGVVGDWVNHMTPEMARRLDDIVADKIHPAGRAQFSVNTNIV
ncbi:unnamed protein product [Alopecurus aequalis]